MSLVEKFEEFIDQGTFPSHAHALAFDFFNAFLFDSEDPNANLIWIFRKDSGLCISFKKDNLFFHDLKMLKKWIRKACFNFDEVMSVKHIQMIISFWSSQLYQNTS